MERNKTMHKKILKQLEDAMKLLLVYREKELEKKTPFDYDYLLDSINALDDAIANLNVHIADNV